MRSLIETRSPIIDRYMELTEHIDYATRNGRYYSDRAPGAALLAIPLYWLGSQMPPFMPPVSSRHDPDNPRLFWALLAPALAAWLMAWLFWRFERHMGVRPGFAWLGCLTLLLGTTVWRYGTMLFSHIFSACVLMAAIWAATRLVRGSWRSSLGLGVLLGVSVIMEYQNALFVGVVVLVLLATRRVWGLWPTLTLGVGIALSIFPLLLYFKICFGGWFSSSYSARPAEPLIQHLGGMFSGNMGTGLVELLWKGSGNIGWMLRMPFLGLGLLGYVLARKPQYRELRLPLLGLIPMVLLISTFHMPGGFTGDGRYMVPFIALALLPAPLVLQKVVDWHRWIGGGLVVAFMLLALMGAMANVSLIANYFDMGWHCCPMPYLSWWTDPWGEIRRALPYVKGLPLFALGYFGLAAASLLVIRLKESHRRAGSSADGGTQHPAPEIE